MYEKVNFKILFIAFIITDIMLAVGNIFSISILKKIWLLPISMGIIYIFIAVLTIQLHKILRHNN